MRTSMHGVPPFLFMQEVEPLEGGVRIHLRAQPTRDARSRAAFGAFKAMLDQVSVANRERFRAIAESEFAARREADAPAPEPDLPEIDETLRQRTAVQAPSAPLAVE